VHDLLDLVGGEGELSNVCQIVEAGIHLDDWGVLQEELNFGGFSSDLLVGFFP
jgi:hypothetical protein